MFKGVDMSEKEISEWLSRMNEMETLVRNIRGLACGVGLVCNGDTHADTVSIVVNCNAILSFMESLKPQAAAEIPALPSSGKFH